MTLPVAEIFGPTIQGEGSMIGTPCAFVRLGGCDYRCEWCDSMFAVDPKYQQEWQRMEPQDIAVALDSLIPDLVEWIVLSGGNPAIHNLDALIDELHAHEYSVAMETQGTVLNKFKWGRLDWITLSPKPPSSGNVTPLGDVISALADMEPSAGELKVVVFNDDDLQYAEHINSASEDWPVMLSSGTLAGESRNHVLARYAWLVDQAAGRGFARILPQLHVVTWGHERGR